MTAFKSSVAILHPTECLRHITKPITRRRLPSIFTDNLSAVDALTVVKDAQLFQRFPLHETTIPIAEPSLFDRRWVGWETKIEARPRIFRLPR